MEWLLVQDFPHDVIIIDSWTMVLNWYGLTKSKKTLETIKKVFRGKKVYIIAHTNKKVPPVLETGFERYVMGGQFLFQQATAVFLLVFKDNRRYLKVLKANRNSYDMYRGDLWLL
jgi:archaellum biogenesis ATPase FlaH